MLNVPAKDDMPQYMCSLDILQELWDLKSINMYIAVSI